MTQALINPLWMVHVIGPDDVHPAPDFDTAVQWCAEQNAFFGPISAAGGITLKFVPALWQGTPEDHAAGLPASIEKWTDNEKPEAQKGKRLPCRDCNGTGRETGSRFNSCESCSTEIAAAIVSEGERKVVHLLAQAWNAFLELPNEHPDDCGDFRFTIRRAQGHVLMRLGRRQINTIQYPPKEPQS